MRDREFTRQVAKRVDWSFHVSLTNEVDVVVYSFHDNCEPPVGTGSLEH